MRKVIRYSLIAIIIILGALTINHVFLDVNNSLRSKIDGNNTITLLKEVKSGNRTLTFSVESNIDLWNHRIGMEVDVFKKEFLDYKQLYGEAVKAKVIKDQLSINKFLFKEENKYYFYGYIENPEIKTIKLESKGKSEEAEILSYYGHRFWFVENNLGNINKIKVIMNDGNSSIIEFNS